MQDIYCTPLNPKSIMGLFELSGEFANYLKHESEEFINGPHEVSGYYVEI